LPPKPIFDFTPKTAGDKLEGEQYRLSLDEAMISEKVLF